MYKSFHVQNFKCFQDLTIQNLVRINLIAGMNNTGKTALLEALFVHSGINPDTLLRINVFRGINPVTFELSRASEAPWDSSFRMFDTTQTMELVGEYDNHSSRTIKLTAIGDTIGTTTKIGEISSDFSSSNASLSIQKTPTISERIQGLKLSLSEGNQKSEHELIINLIQDRKGSRVGISVVPPVLPSTYQTVIVPARYISIKEDVGRFGKLEANKKLAGMLKALKVLEPRLVDLAIITEKGETMIAGDIGLSRFIPSPYMGEGTTRLMSLLLAIAFAQNGVVLIDEIENGLHHSVLEKVWRSIGEAARDFNVQIFATTHSFECIKAAHAAFSSRKFPDFNLYRLERSENASSIISYSTETLSAAIKAGYEVR